jgi:hypothetical protein
VAKDRTAVHLLSSRIDIGPSRDDERMVPAVAWDLRPLCCNTRASERAVILARGALGPPLGKPCEIDVARLICFLSLLARSAFVALTRKCEKETQKKQ